MVKDFFLRGKLIILYMLYQIDSPLPKSHVTDFIMEQDYGSYFDIATLLDELLGAGLILAQSTYNRSFLVLTADGKDTYEYLGNSLNYYVKDKVDTYLIRHDFEIRNQLAKQANYYKVTNGDYEAHLVLRERNQNLMDLRLSMPTEKLAATACEKWDTQCEPLYEKLLQELL